jgi:hypothetical protein
MINQKFKTKTLNHYLASKSLQIRPLNNSTPIVLNIVKRKLNRTSLSKIRRRQMQQQRD